MATVKELKAQAKKEKMEVDTSKLDQKPEGIQLTESELNMIANFQRNSRIIQEEISLLANQRLNIDYRQQEAEALYRKNLEFEKQIGETLTQKYGNGTIDIENGLFLPS